MANDVNLFGCPDRLTANRTHNLAGGAGPLASRGRCSGLGCACGSRAHGRGECVAAQQDFVPAFCQCVLHQIVPWGGVPSILPTWDTCKPVGFGNFLKSLIVILPASGYLFYVVFPTIQVAHFMQEGINHFFDWIIKCLC